MVARVALTLGAALVVWLAVGCFSAQVACAHDPRFVCSPRTGEHPVAIPDASKSWAYYGGLARNQSDAFALRIDRPVKVPWSLLIDRRDAGNPARPVGTLYDAAGNVVASVTFSARQSFYEPFSRESYVESSVVSLRLAPGRYSIVVRTTGGQRQRYVMAIGEAERFSPFEIPYVVGAIARIRALRY